MHKVIYESSAHQSSQASDCRWPVTQAPTKGGWQRNNLIGEQVMRLLSLHLNKIGKSWAVHGRAEQLHVRVTILHEKSQLQGIDLHTESHR